MTRRGTIRRSLLLTALCLFGALLLPSSAMAEGGTSIATAPVVTWGEQEFGNTAQGTHLFVPHGFDQFWGLNVVAGDKLTIDWEGAAGSETCGCTLRWL